MKSGLRQSGIHKISNAEPHHLATDLFKRLGQRRRVFASCRNQTNTHEVILWLPADLLAMRVHQIVDRRVVPLVEFIKQLDEFRKHGFHRLDILALWQDFKTLIVQSSVEEEAEVVLDEADDLELEEDGLSIETAEEFDDEVTNEKEEA